MPLRNPNGMLPPAPEMSFLYHSALCCPHDKLALQQSGSGLQCSAGHHFDIARQGYVNLLSPNDKRSRDPGDSRAMVVARRAFLQAGYYQHLADTMGHLLQGELGAGSVVVDAGCGDGYYTGQLCRQQHALGRGRPAIIGFDISKWAMQLAARSQAATWMVASNRKIPLADHCADTVLSVFGFPHYAEFARILKPGGLLLLVEPGPGHLIQLRSILYESLRPYRENSLQPAIAVGFRPAGCSEVRFETTRLEQDAIANVLAMTPHLYRASAIGKQRVGMLDSIELTVDVRLNLLRA